MKKTEEESIGSDSDLWGLYFRREVNRSWRKEWGIQKEKDNKRHPARKAESGGEPGFHDCKPLGISLRCRRESRIIGKWRSENI